MAPNVRSWRVADLRHGGADNLVIGTDYGHADTSAQIEALRIVKKEGKVDASVIDRILDDNARALYGWTKTGPS